MWEITLSLDGKDTVLPEDVEIAGDVFLANNLEVSSAKGKSNFRRNQKCLPVVLVLTQPLGHDETLFKLFNKAAGFKLKLTYKIAEDDESGNVKWVDILDINLTGLVPESISIGAELLLTLKTMSAAEIKWLVESPDRVISRNLLLR